jgi:hypothetical protein
MFGDWEWDQTRYAEQQARYSTWLCSIEGMQVVAIEIGAGLAIPTVRNECEARGKLLVRINPREAYTSGRGISLQMGALEALVAINAFI